MRTKVGLGLGDNNWSAAPVSNVDDEIVRDILYYWLVPPSLCVAGECCVVLQTTGVYKQAKTSCDTSLCPGVVARCCGVVLARDWLDSVVSDPVSELGGHSINLWRLLLHAKPVVTQSMW